MLIDPEKPFEEWSDNVRAKSQAEAEMKCERLVRDRAMTEVINVSQSTTTPNKAGTYSFVCWFRTELPHDSNNDPDN
jgi:hypothetical protein